LTKPIGTGIITTALKAGKISEEDAAETIKVMRALNRGASEAMAEAGVNACTDITGYGLLGHAMEMARGSNACLVIRSGDIKLLPGAIELAAKRSCRPRNLMTTKEFLKDDVSVAPGVDGVLEMLLYDPQTSGGLLISVPEDKEGRLIQGLVQRRVGYSVIGRVEEKGKAALIRVE
ncbi:MAG: selenide, water dikinase SelD, partial [Deltaproteobacteria bacterium]|nr:selenide, water dikinase SelD [Deltaproteobacteria bacterium]